MKTNIVPLFDDHQPTPRADPAAFEAFWKTYPYPRRQGKAVAKAKFDQITTVGLKTRTLDKDSGQYVELTLQDTPENIIKGTEAYANSHKNAGSGAFGYKDNGKFIMQPNTFLNRGAWMDWI